MQRFSRNRSRFDLRRETLGRVAAALAFAAVTLAVPAVDAADPPLPRFVSLKAGRVNVRVGPSNEHQVKWIFVKSGLPVEVVQEFENWRRIRDSSGEEGWVYHSLLSGRRTAIVAPWNGGAAVALHVSPGETTPVVAVLEPKVLTKVDSCDGSWCYVEGRSGEGPRFEGFMPQQQLWGVYPDEVFR